jgi:hypothetical protein
MVGMEGNPETEPVRGDRPLEAEAQAPANNEPQGQQNQSEATNEALAEDTANANVKSWIEAQSETQPQKPQPEPPTDDASTEVDDAVGELPRVENEAPSTVLGLTGTTAGSASTTTSAPGTDVPAPAPATSAEAGVGVGAGPALITPRGRAASASTGSPSTTAGHGHVPQFVAPSSYLRRRTSIRSPMAPTEPKPLSPLDKDQLQGLVCFHSFAPA